MIGRVSKRSSFRSPSYEKVSKRPDDAFLSELKDLDKELKDKKHPVQIDYYGHYAEVSLPESFLDKIRGITGDFLAELYWNRRDAKWELVRGYDGSFKTFSDLDFDQVVNELVKSYDAVMSQAEKKDDSYRRPFPRKRFYR